MESLAAPLVAVVTAAAPRLRLRFAPKPDKDAGPIRDGTIDLEIGTLGTTAPEVRVQTLFRDRFVGVVRMGHPLFDHRDEDYLTRTLCGLQACGGLAQGPVLRPRRRGARGARAAADDRRRGPRLSGRHPDGAVVGPRRARALVMFGTRCGRRCRVTRRAAVRTADANAGDRRCGDLASAHGQRPGSPLDALSPCVGLPGGATASIVRRLQRRPLGSADRGPRSGLPSIAVRDNALDDVGVRSHITGGRRVVDVRPCDLRSCLHPASGSLELYDGDAVREPVLICPFCGGTTRSMMTGPAERQRPARSS